MIIFLICFVILGAALPGCHAGAYTILASDEIRPLSEFRVAVTRTAPGEGVVNLELEGRGYREAQLATLAGFSTDIVSFRTGALEKGDFTLTARAVYGDEFFTKTTIRSTNKTYCVFLHTDKTVYQAGDSVMFRLVVLNMHLKPMPNTKPGMILKDGNKRVLKQWGKLPLTKGVFSEEIQIADFPVLGEWVFEVEVNGQLYTKKFLVADFVLPKFNLNIMVPEHVYYPDGSIPVTITAQQFSGEEVDGELTLTAYPVFYSGVIQPVFQTPLRRVERIKGRLSLQLSLGTELQLRENEAAAGSGGRRLMLEAAIEETLTGRRHNVSALLWLHRTKTYISHQAPDFYKPGLPYTLQVQLSNWEGAASWEEGAMLIIRHGFPARGDQLQEVSLPVDESGRVTHTIYPESDANPTPMTIELQYKDLKEVLNDIMPPSTPRENLIQPTLVTLLPAVGGEVHVKVNSTTPMRALTYYVIGRGEVIFAKTFQIIPTRRTDELKFQASHAMAPEAVLLVCHVSETSEMDCASLQFQVQGLLQNNVELYVSPEEPEPLGNVDITVKAEPDSYVALMASSPSPKFSVASDHQYDAGQGDGLSMDTVLKEVRSFSPFKSELKHLFREIGSGANGDPVHEMGMVLLTDNRLGRESEFSGSPSLVGSSKEESTRPPLAGPYAFSRVPAPPSTRVHLGALPTETWLFTNITIGPEGKGLLGRRLPVTPGALWGAGAWAVHPVKGLGLAAPRLPRRPARPALRAAAPRKLREGELLALPASLSNPTAREVHAEVTLHNLRQDFRFESNNEIDTPKALELYQRQKLVVPPGRAGTVVFYISVPPSAEGPRTTTLQLTATAVGLADSYEHEIIIMPAGEPETSSVSDLLDLASGSASTNLTLAVPPPPRARQRTLPPSTYSVSIWGWALAPALVRLPSRSSLPPPSGYHNMLPYMEATVLIQTLDSKAQLSDSVRASSLDLMRKIYQQQLGYLQADGSFSIHKNSDQEGSIWVTGFTTRWLGVGMGTGRRDAGVPASVVRAALQWLASKQQLDGHWEEGNNQPLEDSLQQESLVLTALTLITFLDTKHLTLEEYANVASKAQDWLARHVTEATMRGAATLAPVAAALAASRHPAAFQATNTLSNMANVSDGVRWWEVNGVKDGPLREHGRSGRGLTTLAWAALALLKQGLRAEAAQLARPLLGGVQAGTAAAPLLPALASLATAMPATTAASVEFLCPAGNRTTMLIVNKGNYLLVQEQEVHDRHCSVSAHGSGMVAASLQASRRTNVTAPWPRFTLDPRVDTTSTAYHLQLTICIGFVTELGEDTSGPVLLEMRLPSGFEIDVDLPALLVNGKVRSGKVGETLQLILAPMGPRETCLTLGAPRVHAVAREHPGVITVRDLDDDSRRARVFFTPGGGSGLCDVCWGKRCTGACGDPAERPPPLSPRGQVATTSFPGDEDSSADCCARPLTIIRLLTAVLFSKLLKMLLFQ